MVLRSRISLTQLILATVVYATASCRCTCGDEGDNNVVEPSPQTDPPIAKVEVVPNLVSVPQGTSFELRARVKDQWGNILPDVRASDVTWTTSGDVAAATGEPKGSSVMVRTSAVAPPPTKDTSYVIASVAGVATSDSARVVVTGVPEPATHDWIAGPAAPNGQPSYALLSGPSNYGEPSTRVNSLVAFVKEGALDPFACPPTTSKCGAITLFSSGSSISQVPAAWSTGCDVASFVAAAAMPPSCTALGPPIPQLVPPLQVKAVVWTLANRAGIDNQVKADQVYAQSVFAQPFIGLAIDIRVNTYANKHTSITHGLACKDVEGNELYTDVAPFSVTFDPKIITVVYVDAINPGTGDDIGFTCPYDDVHNTGTLIFVSADAINNSTLAHELGHALGQWHSGERDHPDTPPPRLDGFDPSNLMWSSESDWGVSLRRNLTLGQIFQINFADFSFVQKAKIATAAALHCSTDASSNSPCPPLAKDPRQ